jgi:hypothetical protein
MLALLFPLRWQVITMLNTADARTTVLRARKEPGLAAEID